MLHLLFYFLALFQSHAQDDKPTDIDTINYTAPRQYIFADRESEEFSERTLNAPYTDIKPNPLILANSTFENLFYANTSIQAKSQGSPTISLRGSNQAARVLFVLDDIPLNFADGFGGSSLLIPFELIQNIHVIEGPTSALYGANAMAGAVHFKTKNFDRPVLRIGVGDADKNIGSPLTTTNASVVAPYSLSENHSFRGSVFLEKDRGDFRHTTDGISETRKDNAQSMRRFTLGSRHQLNNWRINTFTLYSGLNKVTPGPVHTPLITSQMSDVFFAALNAKYKDESYTSSSVLSASRFRSQYIDFGYNHSNSEKLFASEIFVKKLSNKWIAQTTLDFNWNRYQSSYTGTETFDRTEPEIAQTFIYEALPGLTFEPTLRYLSRYKQLIGQIHIPYRMDQARVWLSLGEGFRPPSLTDLYAQTSYYVGNRDLYPEESFQSEIGLGWDFKFISVSSSVYQTRYTDLFQSVSVSPGVVSKTNIGKAETTGINMGVQIQPHADVQIRLNHSVMSAREKPNNVPLLFSPQNQSFVSVSYARNTWSATLQQTLWSSFYDIDFNTGQKVRISAWEGTDLLLSRQMHKDLSVGMGLFNIFDNPRQLSFDFPEPQRRLFLNLEMQF